jgi:RNA polymerase sigma-70 factor (ECF subfamily)
MRAEILVGKEIIEECKNGSITAFRDLVSEVSPFVFAVAFRIVRDEMVAEDIVQESLITVWKNIRKIRLAGSFKSWLYKITINKCYDYLRKEKSNPEFCANEKTWDLISNHITAEPSTEMENREIAQIINLLTEQLSPRQKVVFVLSQLEELSHDEISDVTGMSKRLIKANLHYAKKNICEMIEKYI